MNAIKKIFIILASCLMIKLTYGCCIGDDIFYKTAASAGCLKKMENPAVESMCLLTCIFEKYNLLDGENVKFGAVKTFIESMDEKVIPKEYVQLKQMIGPVLVKEVEFCEKNAAKWMVNLDKFFAKVYPGVDLSKHPECRKSPVALDLCLGLHLLTNCPEKLKQMVQQAAGDKHCHELMAHANQTKAFFNA